MARRARGGLTHFQAIPEHLANVFNATLSPRSKFLAGPLTVATLILGCSAVGRTGEPSVRCQVTLPGEMVSLLRLRTGERRKEGGKKRKNKTYEQPKYAKISLTNGTPARTPCAAQRVSLRFRKSKERPAASIPRSYPTTLPPPPPLQRRTLHSQTKACLRRARRVRSPSRRAGGGGRSCREGEWEGRGGTCSVFYGVFWRLWRVRGSLTEGFSCE